MYLIFDSLSGIIEEKLKSVQDFFLVPQEIHTQNGKLRSEKTITVS